MLRGSESILSSKARHNGTCAGEIGGDKKKGSIESGDC